MDPKDLPERISRGLDGVPLVEEVRRALGRAGVADAWLVGGLPRDLALGASRPGIDVDVALPGSGEASAREVARSLRGSAFALDEAQGAWRVALPGGATVDLVPLRAPTLEGDLRGRDFTVNALAFDLLGDAGLCDPLGALADLRDRILSTCSENALLDDPVRVLRAYRFASGLGLTPSPSLGAELTRAAPGLATATAERVRTELFALLALPRGARALRDMERHGVLRALFPFLAGWRGFDQGDYHAHDLLEHALRTAEAVEQLANRPEDLVLPRPEALRLHLSEEWEAGISRGALLKCAALLHDIAKPETLTIDGSRRRFLGHEVQGGRRLREVFATLRLGRRVRAAAQGLVAAHLRLFGLAHQTRPTRTARLRYLRDLGRQAPEALLLSLADELATGPEPPALAAVTATARELLSLHWEQLEKKPSPPLLRGRDILETLGVPPGPAVGEILRQVGDAETRGDVTTPEEALTLARRIAEEGERRRGG